MRSSRQRLWYLVAGVLVVAIIAAVAVIVPRAGELWNGKPYPQADPDAVAERVQDRSRDLFLEMRLRDPITLGFNYLRSSTCKRTSLINAGRTDHQVIGVRHNWGVRNIDERAARGAMDTLADRLYGDGWKAGYAYDNAAIGSIYFLARPNPRPDDLGLAVHTINDWITRAVDDGRFGEWVRSEASLGLGARKVRDLARSQWYRVLARRMSWRSLGEDRETITWDLLVLIWQVIGRSVRGAVPTRVAFVDAAFSPNLAAGGLPRLPDTPKTSLLHSIHDVLKPYFAPVSGTSAADRHIVQALYRPMWTALDRCLTGSGNERNTACTD